MQNDASGQGPVEWYWDDGVTAQGAAISLRRDGKLYTAQFSQSATGCTVLAQDAVTGAVFWQRVLEGLGSVHHSKYSNAVQMQFVGERLAVFGKESAGSYIEVLDSASGTVLYQRVIGAEP